jgi:hypothetical protein
MVKTVSVRGVFSLVVSLKLVFVSLRFHTEVGTPTTDNFTNVENRAKTLDQAFSA